MDKKRDWREVKEIGLKRLKETYEKNTGSVIPPDKLRQYEKQYETSVLPKIYDKGKN